MFSVSASFQTVLARIALVLLPGIVFPAIYFAYRRTRFYRIGDIKRLADSVSTVRRGMVDERASKDLRDQLLSELDDLYNWKNYAVSLTMSCLTSWIAAFVALSTLKLPLGITDIQDSLFGRVPAVVFAGIAGAYVANLIDLSEHARVRNLTSSYFQITWVRLISGAVLGYMAGRLFAANVAILAAFGIGLAPLKEGVDWMMEKARGAWGKNAKAPAPSEQPTLHHLQGMTEDVLNTLKEHGITSAEQLAYASPAKLLARTNLEWVAILDGIDQALLFNYFGESISQLRILGIRGSIEMGTLHEELQDREHHLEAEGTLQSLAVIFPNLDESSLRYAIRTLHDDISVKRLAYLFGSGLGQREQRPFGAGKAA